MASLLTGLALNIRLQLTAIASKTTDLSSPSDSLSIDQTLAAAFGATAGLVDQVWADRITLAGGASTELDLQALTNAFGDTANFSLVKAVLIINRSVDIVADAPPPTIEIGNASGTIFLGWFKNSSDIESLAANPDLSGDGNIMLHTNLSAGWSTNIGGAGLTRKLKILNAEAVDDAIFDVVIVGVNA